MTPMHNLAGIYESQNDPSKAETLCRQVLAVRERKWGGAPRHARLYAHVGLVTTRLRSYKKILTVQLGADTLDIVCNLATPRPTRYAKVARKPSFSTKVREIKGKNAKSSCLPLSN
jgi:hypothetical protein